MVQMPFENRIVIHNDKWINSSFQLEALLDVDGDDVVSYKPQPCLLHILLNRLSKWLIAASYYGVIVLRHDDVAVKVWAVVGSVLNVSLSLALKRIIYQERPDPQVSSGPGMPSSHAQSVSFAVIFFILSIIGWLGLNEFSYILNGLVIIIGLYFSWLRILLRYHTTSQVIAGLVVGSIFSVFWFCTCDPMVLKAYSSRLWL